jgi:hypothetical protein
MPCASLFFNWEAVATLPRGAPGSPSPQQLGLTAAMRQPKKKIGKKSKKGC